MVSGYPRRLGLRGFQAGFSCNPRILPLPLQDPLFLGLRLTLPYIGPGCSPAIRRPREFCPLRPARTPGGGPRRTAQSRGPRQKQTLGPPAAAVVLPSGPGDHVLRASMPCPTCPRRLRLRGRAGPHRVTQHITLPRRSGSTEINLAVVVPDGATTSKRRRNTISIPVMPAPYFHRYVLLQVFMPTLAAPCVFHRSGSECPHLARCS